jgi:hypothetical protein
MIEIVGGDSPNEHAGCRATSGDRFAEIRGLDPCDRISQRPVLLGQKSDIRLPLFLIGWI